MQLEIFRLIFEKCSNIKLDESPSSENRAVTFGRADTTKLIGALRNSANAPENDSKFSGRDEGHAYRRIVP